MTIWSPIAPRALIGRLGLSGVRHAPAFARHGALRFAGTRLVDASGKAVTLRVILITHG